MAVSLERSKTEADLPTLSSPVIGGKNNFTRLECTDAA